MTRLRDGKRSETFNSSVRRSSIEVTESRCETRGKSVWLRAAWHLRSVTNNSSNRQLLLATTPLSYFLYTYAVAILTSASVANFNNHYYENMPLFAGLPPELRVMIYMHLLQDGLASGKRIVYYHKDDQHNKSNSPSEEHMSANLQPECGAVGWSRSAMKYEMNHQRRITSLVNGHNRYGPDVQKRVICHADIDALLSLANTCRQIRAEVLYIAWSNGKITIYAPDDRFKDDVFHIFGHCLSVEVCRMIRHLNIDIGKVNWSASYAHQTAHFIIKRLPNLEKLNICVARDDTEDPEPDIGDGLRAITCLPLRIFVQIKVYIHPSIANQQPLPRLVVHSLRDGVIIMNNSAG